MTKYKNKNFRISIVEIAVVIIVALSFFVGGLLYDSYIQTKDLYNIEKTDVDFIVQSPSDSQVVEMEMLSHIDKVTPYVYYSSDFSVKGKNVKSNLFVIQDKSDLKYTVFSDQLLESEKNVDSKNEIYISNDFASSLSLIPGDEISTIICGQNVKFTIASIYKSDNRQVGGMAIATMSGDVLEALSGGYKYSGAYIKSNDIAATEDFLESYVPLGDLRSRDEFDSDELYQIYLDKRAETDYTLTTFYRESYLNEVSKRNDSKMLRESLLVFGIMGGCALILFAFYLVRTLMYCKTEVRKDIKNKFSFKQEQSMFNKYFVLNLIVVLLCSVIFAFVGSLIFDYALLEINNIVAVSSLTIAVIASWIIQRTILKSKFFKT
ncbi:MAG: hypothetical protein IJD42_06705 [Clostridia bacterium]|nr:hypothetical protein [Clostridia bacterium]